MSSKETPGAQDDTREIGAESAVHDDRQGSDNTVAQKLSHELDNWRRQRNGAKLDAPPGQQRIQRAILGTGDVPSRCVDMKRWS